MDMDEFEYYGHGMSNIDTRFIIRARGSVGEMAIVLQ